MDVKYCNHCGGRIKYNIILSNRFDAQTGKQLYYIRGKCINYKGFLGFSQHYSFYADNGDGGEITYDENEVERFLKSLE